MGGGAGLGTVSCPAPAWVLGTLPHVALGRHRVPPDLTPTGHCSLPRNELVLCPACSALNEVKASPTPAPPVLTSLFSGWLRCPSGDFPGPEALGPRDGLGETEIRMTQGFGGFVFLFPSVLVQSGLSRWETSVEFQAAKLGAGEGGARRGSSAGEALLA